MERLYNILMGKQPSAKHKLISRPYGSLDRYCDLVLAAVVKRIGGSPKFEINTEGTRYCYERNYDPTVAAEELIKEAIRVEKERAKERAGGG